MAEWKEYTRKGIVQARPYVPGEDLQSVSVSDTDTPGVGDMVARNPLNFIDQWLISCEYFAAHYTEKGTV